uniref:CUB domain-containing protein n=1 Tax=Ascaris lumbricoides TaxID=6252 RepID=A0A0M3HKP2_ASCLU
MNVRFRSNNTLGRASRMFCLERKCGFDIDVEPSKIECGGEISDQSGRITTPGYPKQLIAHIACDWKFYAGIGYRYIFDFSFIKQDVS